MVVVAAVFWKIWPWLPKPRRSFLPKCFQTLSLVRSAPLVAPLRTRDHIMQGAQHSVDKAV